MSNIKSIFNMEHSQDKILNIYKKCWEDKWKGLTFQHIPEQQEHIFEAMKEYANWCLSQNNAVQIIELNDWNDLVQRVYGKIYNYQQQHGCQERGTLRLTIPSSFTFNDDFHDNIKDLDGDMGIKFNIWLNQDPNIPLKGDTVKDIDNSLFWERNFYPDIYTLANDMYSKGHILPGEYIINIDW